MALQAEVIEKIAALLTAAFGLVAALAWNEAILAIFAAVFGEAGNIAALVGYAILVTVIAVAVTIWIGRKAGEAKSGS
jgi:hypothetical protein